LAISPSKALYLVILPTTYLPLSGVTQDLLGKRFEEAGTNETTDSKKLNKQGQRSR
jgi:hypothetical protein